MIYMFHKCIIFILFSSAVFRFPFFSEKLADRVGFLGVPTLVSHPPEQLMHNKNPVLENKSTYQKCPDNSFDTTAVYHFTIPLNYATTL